MEAKTKTMTASEMARKRWAAVSLEDRIKWSRAANAKRWAKVRAAKAKVGK